MPHRRMAALDRAERLCARRPTDAGRPHPTRPRRTVAPAPGARHPQHTDTEARWLAATRTRIRLRQPLLPRTAPLDLHVPAISAAPDKSEALAAIRLLGEPLLTDFPFIDDGGASRAVGLSLLITAVIRAAMIVAPVHAARSPAAGTGKSYWYDVAAAIVYGDRCPVVFAGKSREELERS